MTDLISPDEAFRRALGATWRLPAEAVRMEVALGRVLDEAVAADRDDPPFDRAMMDGYAVRADDAGRTIAVVGEIAAGAAFPGELRPGEALEIMTGAPLPAGADAVAQHEIVTREGEQVTLPGELRPGQNIARRGSLHRAGDVVLPAGAELTPLAIGVLASVGRVEVQVIRAPRVAIITTGNELARGGEAPGAAAIRDSNGPMLAALLCRVGVEPVAVAHAADTAESLAFHLRAVDEEGRADIIILTGGVSAGKYDLVPGALAALGAAPLFHKVSQRPGKPLLVAKREGERPLLCFGLPGNPLSCHVGFVRYIRPVLRRMQGLADEPELSGMLAAPVRNSGPRVAFILAIARWDGEAAIWKLDPLRGKGSADLTGATAANAMLRVDPVAEPLAEGDRCPFVLL